MLLSADNLRFAYPGNVARTSVLDDVSLLVERSAAIGILGPNGSGKTTLLKMLAGVLRPDAGVVRLDGTPIAAIRRAALARRIAIVPQETHPAFEYTVLEMVLMGRYPHLGAFEIEGPDDLRLAREALAATGTAALEARSFDTLSGGEKQRVVIAAALAQSADVLLLDEPTASLDLGVPTGSRGARHAAEPRARVHPGALDSRPQPCRGRLRPPGAHAGWADARVGADRRCAHAR